MILLCPAWKRWGKANTVKPGTQILHSREDEVIPFAHGEALLAAAAGPKRSLWVPGATHNDVAEVAGERYWEALREFAEICARAQRVSP